MLTSNTVNGQPGVVFAQAGKVIHVLTFAAEEGVSAALYSVLNPDKLRRWPSEARMNRMNLRRTKPEGATAWNRD